MSHNRFIFNRDKTNALALRKNFKQSMYNTIDLPLFSTHLHLDSQFMITKGFYSACIVGFEMGLVHFRCSDLTLFDTTLFFFHLFWPFIILVPFLLYSFNSECGIIFNVLFLFFFFSSFLFYIILFNTHHIQHSFFA